MSRRVTAWVAAIALLAAMLVPGPGTLAAAADVTFGAPSATATLGQPLVVTSTFTAPQRPTRVELLSHLPSERIVSVETADVATEPGGGFRATLTEQGHVLPNTTLLYRFRVTLPDGSSALGPEASATVTDDRFDWRTLDGELVRLHWYDGDDAFAQRAVQIGDEAVRGAEELLGVQETERIDFFIYAAEGEIRDALGPGTRENVGGQAVASIRTLFGLIRPSEINSDWVDVLVTHELTHLVFNTAVDNPYHLPPRWLNEGLAVFRSQGYTVGDRALVSQAARNGELIPLDGLAGLFPTGDGFSLAYAESASGVSYMIDTFGQEALVKLIRSYASGVTDDEAFSAAIGRTAAVLNDEWLASLGASAPEPLGPRPAPPGPTPPGWADVPIAVSAGAGFGPPRLGALLPLVR
jgi:hypothetical protein